jgi:hypothetical protein
MQPARARTASIHPRSRVPARISTRCCRPEAMTLGGRICVMHDGRVAQIAPRSRSTAGRRACSLPATWLANR